MLREIFGLGLGLLAAGGSHLFAEPVTVETDGDRVRIAIGGKPFTEYVFSQDAPRPYFFPVFAADGTEMTREYPMANPAGEEHDHPNHRSIWFGHGLVNGHDFWADPSQDRNLGKVVQERLVEAHGGQTALIRTRDLWQLKDGSPVCSDEREISAQGTDTARFLDFAITLHADHGPLTFGDTRDGAMAIRVAEWLTLPHVVKKKRYPGTGRAVNSGGVAGGAAWGKRADWVDYYGPHGGKILGLALFDDPRNPRHPPWWMVREYGLLTANPFGRHEFEKLANSYAGDFTVPAGGSVTFRYRFYFHEGDPAAAEVSRHYADFAAGR